MLAFAVVKKLDFWIKLHQQTKKDENLIVNTPNQLALKNFSKNPEQKPFPRTCSLQQSNFKF